MNDEDIALVRYVRPDAPPDDPAIKSRALARLRAEFDAAPARRRRPPARVGWGLAATGVMTVGAAVAIAMAQLGGPVHEVQRHPGASMTARTLELAAIKVEYQPVPPRPQPHQWIYTQTVSKYALQPGDVAGPEAMLRDKVRVEEWWRFDGTEMAESVQNGKLYIRRILKPGQRPRPGIVDPRYNGGSIGGPAIVNRAPRKQYNYAAGLPADPDALLTRIRQDYRDTGKDVTTFGVIAGILRGNRLIPPKVNAALYRALAKIPSVRIVNNTTDYAGRRGIGVVFGQGASPGQIILNPQTYRYMGDGNGALLGFAVVDRPGHRR